MHFRQKLTFMALGSILTIAGYLLATLTSDVTAQSETDKSEPLFVNEIVCRKLRVVGPRDKTRVEIGPVSDGGYMDFKTFDGAKAIRISAFLRVNAMTFWGGDKTGLFMSADSDGGGLRTFGAGGSGGVSMGEGVAVWDKNGKRHVVIGSSRNGGYMDVRHASGKKVVAIGVSGANEVGFVSAWSKGEEVAVLSAREHGGRLYIYSNKNILNSFPIDSPRVVIGTSEKGDGFINTVGTINNLGTITTLDKNGLSTFP